LLRWRSGESGNLILRTMQDPAQRSYVINRRCTRWLRWSVEGNR
jgi:hypothetical protein